MKNTINFIISIMVLFSLAFSCSLFRANKDKEEESNQTRVAEPEKKDQYRIAENYKDNKAQIIDLIQGSATFYIKYEGNTNFTARLLKPDGTLVEVLADINGSFKGSKTINVPETGSYILDIKCTGTWSIFRK
jgi:hypothetical protein